MKDEEIEQFMNWLLENPAYERAPDGSVRLKRDWLSRAVNWLTGESNLYICRVIRFWDTKRCGMHWGTEAAGLWFPRYR